MSTLRTWTSCSVVLSAALAGAAEGDLLRDAIDGVGPSFEGVRRTVTNVGGRVRQVQQRVICDGSSLLVETIGTSRESLVETESLTRRWSPRLGLREEASRRRAARRRLLDLVAKWRGRGGVRETPGPRIAGRLTRTVSIGPPGRPIEVFDVDPEGQMLMRRVRYDERGREAYRAEFLSVRTGIAEVVRLPFERPDDRVALRRVERLRREGFLALRPAGACRLLAARALGSRGREVLAQTFDAPIGRVGLYESLGEVSEERLLRLLQGAAARIWRRDGRTFALVHPRSGVDLSPYVPGNPRGTGAGGTL